MNPTMRAVERLGGSGSIFEIDNEVISELQLPDEVVNQPHGETGQTELKYRLRWARTNLKGQGFLSNPHKGVWALTPDGEKALPDNIEEGRNHASCKSKASVIDTADFGPEDDGSANVEIENAEDKWREDLRAILQEMNPTAFERLCRLLLRASGFIDVQVIGRSGDGGIDGRGIIRLAGLISFPVLFQCKRYSGNNTVSPSQVREFRGAMMGRAEKGLIITTGGFTQAAEVEATRDGAPPIDLIDGDQLIETLKELRIGLDVEPRQVELVSIDADFFANI